MQLSLTQSRTPVLPFGYTLVAYKYHTCSTAEALYLLLKETAIKGVFTIVLSFSFLFAVFASAVAVVEVR